jgi:hypothetical protein
MASSVSFVVSGLKRLILMRAISVKIALTKMAKIKIDSIKEGMVVVSDVKNIDNMLLIPAGCTLTGRQIIILNSWGVSEVDVVASETQADTDILTKLSPAELEKLSAEVKERFWRVDESNPVFMEIFILILQRRVRATRTELAVV